MKITRHVNEMNDKKGTRRRQQNKTKKKLSFQIEKQRQTRSEQKAAEEEEEKKIEMKKNFGKFALLRHIFHLTVIKSTKRFSYFISLSFASVLSVFCVFVSKVFVAF